MTTKLPPDIPRHLGGARSFDPGPLLEFFAGMSDRETAEALGVSRSTVTTWRLGIRRVTEPLADRIGTHLAGHPAMIWPEWFDDAALARANL